MGLSFEALWPHLEALAYLCEIVIAEGMFLGPFEPRKNRRRLTWAGIVLMFAAGTATGIPQGKAWSGFCGISC